MDVGIEYDAGLGRGKQSQRDMLGRSTATDPAPEQMDGCLGGGIVVGGLGGRAIEAEGVLRFSRLVGGGPGRPAKFPLDWLSLKALYGSLPPVEKEGLGLQVIYTLHRGWKEKSIRFHFSCSIICGVRALAVLSSPTLSENIVVGR